MPSIDSSAAPLALVRSFSVWGIFWAAICAGFATGAAAAPGHAHGHTHGQGTMTVVLDGQRLAVELDVPLESLLGFERAPRTDAERRQVQKALAVLRDAGRWLLPAADAGCTLEQQSVDAPELEAAATTQPTARAARPHPDAQVQVQFQCAQPQRLGRLEVRLFEQAPALQKLQVQSVLPTGQRQAVLRPQARVLDWSRR